MRLVENVAFIDNAGGDQLADEIHLKVVKTFFKKGQGEIGGSGILFFKRDDQGGGFVFDRGAVGGTIIVNKAINEGLHGCG